MKTRFLWTTKSPSDLTSSSRACSLRWVTSLAVSDGSVVVVVAAAAAAADANNTNNDYEDDVIVAVWAFLAGL